MEECASTAALWPPEEDSRAAACVGQLFYAIWPALRRMGGLLCTLDNTRGDMHSCSDLTCNASLHTNAVSSHVTFAACYELHTSA